MKPSTHHLLVPFGLLVAFCHAQAPSTPPAGLADSVILRLMTTHHIPTAGIGFIDHGQVSLSRVYGELAGGVPAPETTIFNVASITKTITTMLTLRLVQSGNWNLDEPVYHYWTDPDVQDDPRSKRLTTRHILTHQTGFPNWRFMLPDKKLAFQFEPGTKFQYSGEGMEYLRNALEHKFHRTLVELADSLLFRPLGMHSTHHIWKDDMLGRFAVPHDAAGKALDITKNTGAGAADLLKTTVPDYLKFMRWVMDGAGLSKALYQEMTSPLAKIKDGKYMGLGWAVYPDLTGGEDGISHTGSDPGVQTLVVILPKSKRGLVLFTNSDNGYMLYEDLVKAFLGEQGEKLSAIEMKN